MTADALKQKIAEAFSDVPYPGDERIALHECPECQEIRESFRGQTAGTLLDGVIDSHFDSLPLLSPETFRFFIPAYMRYSLEHPDSTVSFFTRQSLGEAGVDGFYLERWRLFSSRQREAVVAFLESLRPHEIQGDERDQREYEGTIDAGIKLWKEMS